VLPLILIFSGGYLMSINTMKSGDKSSNVRRESIWRRVLWGLPLLGIFLAARTVLNTSISKWLPIVLEAARTGWVEDVGGRVPVNMTYTGIEGLDGFMRGPMSFFTPALAGLDHREFDPYKRLMALIFSGTINPVPTLGQYGSLYAPQRLQTITFLADITCLNAIVAIESFRRGNSMIIALMFVSFYPTCIPFRY
jgi:hypothetical protein